MKILLFFVPTLLLSFNCLGQPDLSLKYGSLNAIEDSDSVFTLNEIALLSDTLFIVEFISPPLNILELNNYKYLKNGVNHEGVESEHLQFKAFLSQYQTEKRRQATNVAETLPYIRYDFRIAMNGAAIMANTEIIQDIEKLNYVKKVYKDFKVFLIDDLGAFKNKADITQGLPNLTGAGTVISIIDTGIDSSHSELSGKVIGGFDFVNNDHDPADDNGHGTFCAAIAAANGPNLKGTAPKAKLLAVKVLGANGIGYVSDIIKGIEYSINPDGDLQTKDNVDIINLSLGFEGGQPDDILSKAVDNAVDNGVFCAVAAGNENKYYSIRSPGCARKAFTVGSSNPYGSTSSFSSKGPTIKSYYIKPDALAQGDNIFSALPGNTYGYKSGTSASTPYVAGAAALLIELHPEWSPEKIKSALALSADKNNEHLMNQGHGVLNVRSAVKLKTLAIPSDISLGIDDLSKNVWTKSDTFYIFNLNDDAQSYTAHIEDNGDAGISYTLQPSTFILNGNDSAKVILTVQINNKILPNSTHETYSYTGKVVVHSLSEEIDIPVAFIKNTGLDLFFDTKPIFTFIHNRAGKEYFIPINDLDHTIFLEDGDYDIITWWNNEMAFDVKENIKVSNNFGIININKSQAVNFIELKAYDLNGERYNITNSYMDLVHKSTGSGVYCLGYIKGQYLLSNFSDNYKLEHVSSHLILNKRNEYCQIPYLINNGVNSSFTLENDFTKLKKIDFQYILPDSINTLASTLVRSKIRGSNGAWEIYFNRDSGHFTNRLVLMPAVDEQEWKYFYQRVYDSLIIDYNNSLYTTSLIRIDKFDSISFFPFHGAEDEEDYLIKEYFPDSALIKVGNQPFFWKGFTNNSSQQIKVQKPYAYFMNTHGDMPGGKIQFKLINAPGDTSLSIFDNYITTETFYEQSAKAGPKKLIVTSGKYYIHEKAGETQITLLFNTNLKDKNPPVLKYFRIISNGKPQDVLISGAHLKLEFSLDEKLENSIINDSVKVYLKYPDSTKWTRISVTKSGNQFRALLNTDYMGYYVLRLDVTDSYGNKIIQKTDPAYFVKGIHTEIVSQPEDQRICIHSEAVLNITAKGTNLKYQWQISDAGNWISLFDNDFMRGTFSNRMMISNPGLYNSSIFRCLVTGDYGQNQISESAILTVITTDKPDGEDLAVCSKTAVAKLTTTGSQIRWYNEPDLINPVHSGDTLIITQHQQGTYLFYVTQTVENCESAPDTVIVTIINSPDPPMADNMYACENEQIPVLLAAGNSVVWYQDEEMLIPVDSGNTFETGLTQPGIYSYYVTQTVDNCESRPGIAGLIINPTPIVSLGNDTTITTSDSLVFSLNKELMKYSWNSGADTLSYFVFKGAGKTPGAYEISVLVTDSNNCRTADSVKVFVDKASDINHNINDHNIIVYPNPVIDELILEIKGNKKQTEFEILNMMGQKVCNGIVIEKTTIKTAGFSSGVYIIRIKNDKSFVQYKIIKN